MSKAKREPEADDDRVYTFKVGAGEIRVQVNEDGLLLFGQPHPIQVEPQATNSVFVWLKPRGKASKSR